MDNQLSIAARQLAHGSKYPYDGGDQTAPAIDWAHSAARGVLADLLDRRGVKWELEKVDLDVRADIVTALAAIIRVAAPSPSTAPEVNERAAFEAWARDTQQGFASLKGAAPGDRGWYYFDQEANDAWHGWKARAALASRPAEVDDASAKAGGQVGVAQAETRMDTGFQPVVAPAPEVDDEGLTPLPDAWHGFQFNSGWNCWEQVCHWAIGDAHVTRAYTAEQYRQGQRDAVGADRARREKLPANAAEMVAFIGSHYNSMRDDKPDPNDIVYELTVHDLLSAFRWWFDDYDLEDEPSHTTNKEK